ncbi:hypothetical protein Tco_0924705 [Tanacetum coccineum]|uniref:Uncharacterized protein n=1 Tax=Tanacetum coccineum TaxID=301880 RepID=A0ABQ5D4N6_9ASTR
MMSVVPIRTLRLCRGKLTQPKSMLSLTPQSSSQQRNQLTDSTCLEERTGTSAVSVLVLVFVNKGENEAPFEFEIDEGGSPLGVNLTCQSKGSKSSASMKCDGCQGSEIKVRTLRVITEASHQILTQLSHLDNRQLLIKSQPGGQCAKTIPFLVLSSRSLPILKKR